MEPPFVELRRWTEADRSAFRAMSADPLVMADLGGPAGQEASDAKFDRYRLGWTTDGISRWAVGDRAGAFLGYAGVVKRSDPDHPLGIHYEIGWRFRRAAWGKGYATQSARRALEHAWQVVDVDEIVSYTAPDNLRSQAVMRRLELERDEGRDFTFAYSTRAWHGLVWVARRRDS